MLQPHECAAPPALWLLPFLAALVMTAGACRSGGGDPAGGATVPTEATTTAPATTTTTEEQSFAIPADPARMDVAYANRVMASLKRVTGDLVRKVVATKTFEFRDLAVLRAVYVDEAIEGQARDFTSFVTLPDSDWKQPPGDNRVEVRRIVEATADCLYFEASIDVSPTVADDPPPRVVFVWLTAKLPVNDPLGVNPTPWSIVAENRDGESRCSEQG
ncbi:MAG TPA: hypothetical protein VFO65_02415 [Acidimicrobiales bacterium]|nr:hypothetical protein [Acidimicrobiales bacterium]